MAIKGRLWCVCASSLIYLQSFALGSKLAPCSTGPNLTVDVGYGVYEGVYDAPADLNTWKGIRYAAPPLGDLRWQKPQTPAKNRTVVVADTYASRCPQSALAGIPALGFGEGDEDCLFLNVFAPANHTGKPLPVLVYIHGGGYGEGDGTTNVTSFINANDNALVGVTIQYRLGAFGFLASNEVKDRGVLNAGLLDQVFALQWVQDNIVKFGGDPSRVTISGESAGAGSVMLHSIAEGGELGTKLFKNMIAASPYLPTQPNYNDAIPTARYYAFSEAAGCPSNGSVFSCLVSKDSLTLQYASSNVSSGSLVPYANWGFIPVTDGTYLRELPSVQLKQKKVNGVNMLVGNNANEGALFVPPIITTDGNLTSWIHSNFLSISDTNVSAIEAAYPGPSTPDDPNAVRYATDGFGPGTAVNVSEVATGHQQRADDIYAEAVFVCSSYWMASAFDSNGHTGYHYQYSVPFAFHSSDLSAYFGPPTTNQGPEFVLAFQKIWGNFVLQDNPSISNAIANGASSANPAAPNPASNWPRWTDTNPMQMILNQTGGTLTLTDFEGVTLLEYIEPGLQNNLTAVNAYTFEGGRGARCDFWRELGPFVPQ